MDRNDMNHFAHVPEVNMNRSRFNMNNRLLTTCSAGELIPIYSEEILPGDSVTMDMSSLIRMNTPIFPTMDNSYADIYWFFCPSRILWTHWREFMGEATNSSWTPSVEYNVPGTTAPSGGWDKGSLADYFGMPTGVYPLKVNSLYFRAYCKIWSEFFRDQNTMSSAWFDEGDNDTYGVRRDELGAVNYASSINGLDQAVDERIQNAARGACCLPVCKFHDYFTSCLPDSQRGNPVDIPLFNDVVSINTLDGAALMWESSSNGSTAFTGSNLQIGNTVGATGNISFITNLSDQTVPVKPTNLVIDQSSVASATINQLRQAFSVQRLLETSALYGSRYRELLRGHFGVYTDNDVQQVPEYLGGTRFGINIDQVVQTSSTVQGVSPQGNTAGYSLTTDVSDMFTKSFTEHGILLGLMCIRTDHTYQQGLDRRFSRFTRYDYFFPELDHIGNQPVYKGELMCTGTDVDNEVFGYQEAWASYRYKNSNVTAAMRSNYDKSLDAWHYADYYDPEGVSSDTLFVRSGFMTEIPFNIDRTLAVPSTTEDQFLVNMYFKSVWTRCMSMYSQPGLTIL